MNTPLIRSASSDETIADLIGITLTSEVIGLVQQFDAAFSASVASFAEAGIVIAALIDIDIRNKEFIVKKYGIPRLVMVNLEKIGRGQHSPLLMDPNTPARKALAGCNIREQEHYLVNPFSVWLPDEKDSKLVELDNLTDFQVRQVFGPNGTVRNLAEQRAWLDSQKSKPNPPGSSKPSTPVKGIDYVVTSDNIIETKRAGLRFNKKMLLAMARSLP